MSKMMSIALWMCLVVACAPKGEDGKHQVAEPAVETRAAVSRGIDSDVSKYDINYLMGRFDPAKHPDFTKIDPSMASRSDMYLRKDTYEAFKSMYEAAKSDGIDLVIISATRNFEYQKGIWNAKWTGARLVEGQNLAKTISDPAERAKKIMEYTAMPGASRHHWGTDFDLNSLDNTDFASGKGRQIYEWLVAHAAQYGFCQPYNTGRPAGYHEEKWHWSYLPVAIELTHLAAEKLKDEMITNFPGAESAPAIGVVANYVLGINTDCL